MFKTDRIMPEREYTLYFTKDNKNDIFKLKILFNKKVNKLDLALEPQVLDENRDGYQCEFYYDIDNYDKLDEILRHYGLVTVTLNSKHLDIMHQFDGIISKPTTKQIFNESITMNVYKVGSSKIKNNVTVYGFVDTRSKDVIILVNRQFVEDDKKIVRCYVMVVKNVPEDYNNVGE